jgi:protein-disulfide isomerase
MFEGAADAKVTLVEFSDFQCPACGDFAAKTLPLLRERYISKGDVRLVFRNFPSGSHPLSFRASEAVECAGRQGRFWQMHDIVFQNQDAISEDNLRKWASAVGLGMDTFGKCFSSGAMVHEVRRDLAQGGAIGVRATPTFYVNGRVLEGSPTMDVLGPMLDEALRR